jgi:hypothetical protein
LAQLAAVGVTIAIVAWLATSPAPRMTGNFGLPLVPPAGTHSAFATVEFAFPSILRGLVTLASVEYQDAAGRYVQEDAWVVPGKSGCAVFAEDVAEAGSFDLGPISGHRLAGRSLTVLFRLCPSPGVPDFAGTADTYSVTLRMRFAGWPFSRRFEWVPADGASADG